jgi:hypothetical protein
MFARITEVKDVMTTEATVKIIVAETTVEAVKAIEMAETVIKEEIITTKTEDNIKSDSFLPRREILFFNFIFNTNSLSNYSIAMH